MQLSNADCPYVMSELALQAFLVEDEPSISRLLADVLEGEGFSVTRFSTTDDGYRYIAAAPQAPALAVFNVSTPGQLTGIELARQAINQWPGLPLILTSGYASIRGLVPDGAHFLAKPWTLKQFTELVRQVTPARVVMPMDLPVTRPAAAERPSLYSRVRRFLKLKRASR